MTLVINVAIVVYLLLAKRLFGLRGGHRAESKRRRVQRLGGHRAGDPGAPTPSSQGRSTTEASAVGRRLVDGPGRRAFGPRSTGWYRRPSRAVGAVGSALA